MAPAGADEFAAAGSQLEDSGSLYRFEWLHRKMGRELESVALAESATEEANAEFAGRVGDMLALAEQQVRRAASGPNPVRLDVHLRCTSKLLIMTKGEARPLVPAMAWSAEEPAIATTLVARVRKACAIKLKRHREAPEGAATTQRVPYSIELPVVRSLAE